MTRARSMSVALGALTLTAGLAGCSAIHELETAGTRPAEANVLHPISVALRREVLDVFGATGHSRDNPDTYFVVTRFVRHYTRDARGPLSIAVPRRGGTVVARDLEMVRSVVRGSGIPSSRVLVHERHDGQSAMTLSFDRVAALGPEHCHDWSDDMARRPEVGPWRNYGCAAQRNLAAMVADPTDLVAPRPEAPRGSERRTTIAREHATSVRVIQSSAEARR